ncbi:MAG: 50S ribosomal protein L6, partial [Erysipelotrichaceae bacterium]|nr:50S ribosomal protein L6 [Erysipelotrichaceae bacterium]
INAAAAARSTVTIFFICKFLLHGRHEYHGPFLNIIGYRAAVANNTLTLTIGYSHPVVITAEEGLTIECPKQDQIVVSGIDKQRVGELAANIRAVRKPEPYKGKGIAYKGEHILRKEGKKAA